VDAGRAYLLTVSTVSWLALFRTTDYTVATSLHSYSRIWVHFVWATLERRPVLGKGAAARLSSHLTEYASQKAIYMKINFVNADHVHGLVDLPTSLSVEEMMHLFKGESSHWINENALVPGKFGWGRGYGVFSVSHSVVGDVARYIAEQEEHHRKRGFTDEFKLFVERYGLEWREDKTVETVLEAPPSPTPR
jgi:putative transposase